MVKTFHNPKFVKEANSWLVTVISEDKGKYKQDEHWFAKLSEAVAFYNAEREHE